MAGVKHTFSVNIADDASAIAAGLVLPSHWNQEHVLSGVPDQASLDALSAVVAGNSAQMTSADNAVSNAVSILSDAHTSLVNRVSANSGTGGAGSVTSNELSAVSAAAASAISIVSNAVSIVSAQVAANSAQMTSADNAISNRLSTWTLDDLADVSAPAPTSTQVLKYNSAAGQWVASADATGGGGASVTSAEYQSLVDRVSANSGTGGAGSVTSAELNAVSAAAASAISIVSNAVSIVSAAQAVTSAAQAATSAAVTSLNTVVSNLASDVSANSAQMTSADNAISNAVSIVSAAQAVTSAAVTSVNAVVSNLASDVSANSAQMTSADNAISAAAAAVSAAVTSLATVVSNLASDVSANSAQMTSADNAISNAVSIVSVAAAAVSADLTSVKNTLSALNSAHNALSNVVSGLGGGGASVTSAEYLSLVNRVSANSGTGGGGSVTSAELSAVSAAAKSAMDALSFTYSGVSVRGAQSALNDIASVISNAMSAGSVISSDLTSVKSVLDLRAPWPAAQIRIMSTAQSANGSALVDMSGLVLTVAAGETWEVDGMLFFSTSAVTTGLKVGTSVPPLSTPRNIMFVGMSAGQSAVSRPGGGILQVSGSSANYSVASTAAGGVWQMMVKAVFNVASAGTFRLQACGVNSTTASPTQFIAGSYFKAFRLK